MPIKKIVLFLMPLLLLLLPKTALARPEGKVVLLFVDNLSIYDLAKVNYPYFNYILHKGGLGLVNTNTAGKTNPENAYLTIAAGTRAVGSNWSGQAFNSIEPPYFLTNDLDLLQEKMEPSSKTLWQTAVVHEGFFQLQALNARLKYRVNLGAFGDLLNSARLKPIVLGNADAFGKPRRFATLLAVNSSGKTGPGIIDKRVLTKDPSFPYLLRTNYAKLFAYYSQALNNYNFFVMETGDLCRLEEYRNYLASKTYQQTKSTTLRRVDNLLGKIIPTLDPKKDLLVLLAPTPSQEDQLIHSNLTPLLLYGKNIEAGFLTSPSTRRLGLVTNTDILPTILKHWELPVPPSFVGRSIYSQKADNTLASLVEINTRLVSNYNHRPLILKPYIIMQIIFILGSIPLLLFFSKKRVIQGVTFGTIYFLIAPWLIIIFGLCQTKLPFLSLALFLALNFILTAVIYYLPLNNLRKMLWIGLATALTLMLDLLFQLGLIQNSPLGYDPIIGARYYGIGNELSGILIGSILLSMPLFFTEKKLFYKIIGVSLLTLAALLIFLPQFGADAGGLITTSIAFGYLLFSFRQKKRPVQLAIILSFLTLLLLGAVLLGDLYLDKNNYSHLGLAIYNILQQGPVAALDIIERKVTMNIKLFNYSIWTKALISFILAFAVLLFRPRGRVLRLKKENPALYKSFSSILIASIVGLMVNDSGIIQGATTFIYLIFPLVYLARNDELAK
ncbi:hypothetical protein RDV78_03145 [Bacillota bacterium LX-D]|nr:hypothetical protein [Bacillota bacterium LX-D]